MTLWSPHYCSMSSTSYLLHSVYVRVTIKITYAFSFPVPLPLCISYFSVKAGLWLYDNAPSHVTWSPSVVLLSPNINLYSLSYSPSSFHSTRRNVPFSGSIQFFSLCAHLWQYYNLIVFHLMSFTETALMTGIWKIQINNVTLFSQRQLGLHMCQIEHNR